MDILLLFWFYALGQLTGMMCDTVNECAIETTEKILGIVGQPIIIEANEPKGYVINCKVTYKGEQSNKTVFTNPHDNSYYNVSERQNQCLIRIDFLHPNYFGTWSINTIYQRTFKDYRKFVSGDENLQSYNCIKDVIISDQAKVAKPKAASYYDISEMDIKRNKVRYLHFGGKIGQTVFIELPEPSGPVKRCIVKKITSGKEEVYHVTSGVDDSKVYYTGRLRSCSFAIRQLIPSDIVSVWEIKTYFTDLTKSNNTIFEIKHAIRVSKLEEKSFYIVAYRGQYFNFANVVVNVGLLTCEVYSRFYDNQTNILPKKTYENKGNCNYGIRIKGGVHILIKHFPNIFTNVVSIFKIDVLPEKMYEMVHTKIIRLDGKEYLSNIDLQKICEEETQKEDIGNFLPEIPDTKPGAPAHYGFCAKRSNPNKTLIDDEIVTLVVRGYRGIVIEVRKSHDNDNSLHVRCSSLKMLENSCRIEKFNGSNFQEITGDNKSVKNKNETAPKNQCELTIQNSSEADHGRWKCSFDDTGKEFRIEKNIEGFGQFNPAELDGISYVQKGDKFMINWSSSCEESVVRGPYGAEFSIIRNSTEFGDCGALVHSADWTHGGSWINFIKFSDSNFLRIDFNIVVIDIYATVNFARNKYDSDHLECELSSRMRKFNFSCSWTHPNGYEISYRNSTHYAMTESNCLLEIKDLRLEDRGNWICYAKLDNGLNKIFNATVRLDFSRKLNEVPCSREATTVLLKYTSTTPSTTKNDTEFEMTDFNTASNISVSIITNHNEDDRPNEIPSVSETTIVLVKNTSTPSSTTKNDTKFDMTDFNTASNISVSIVKNHNGDDTETFIFICQATSIAVDEKIQDCDWIHPYGEIFNENNSTISNYTLWQIGNACLIQFNGSVQNEGIWQCCAHIQHDSNEKNCRKFEFIDEPDSPAVFFTVIGILILGFLLSSDLII